MTDTAKLFEMLQAQLESLTESCVQALERGEDYIPSFLTPDLLIFDVKQPPLGSKQWDELTTRERIEALVFSLPDYLLRDRIYSIPQYLNIHIRGLQYTEKQFVNILARLRKDMMPHVIEIYPEQDHRQTINLSDGISKWGCHEAGIIWLNPGEKVRYNVPILLDDAQESYVFIKLCSDDVIANPYLVFTTETCNILAHLRVIETITLFFIFQNAWH